MFDMEERIMADRKEFEGFKSEFGDATAKYPMQLEDPERLDLAIVYSGIRHNRDAQVAAERLARNYLRINDFDSARKVLDKMGYTPKQIIRDLENLYTFTGSDEYMEMKNTYMENVAADMRKEQKRIRKELEKGMESRKYNLWIHYVNGLRDVQRAQEELKSELGKRKRYLRLVSGKEYLSSNGEWFNEIERLGKEISGGRDAGLDEDSLGEQIIDIDIQLNRLKDDYKQRTREYRHAKSRLYDEFSDRFADSLPEVEPKKKSFFRRFFGNQKKR